MYICNCTQYGSCRKNIDGNIGIFRGNFFHKSFLEIKAESYSEPCQASKTERFAKIFNGF